MRTRTLAGALLLTVVLALSAGAAWATYFVRISDLHYSPLPPGPIKVAGKISSVSPLKISDGRGEIAVSGVTANLGDFLTLEGNWNGTTFAVLQSAGKVVMYSPYSMVYVPAGDFVMGNSGVGNDANYQYPNELPPHSVTLAGYFIGKYDVTRGQYRAFINAGGYSPGPGGAQNPYWSVVGWSWLVSFPRSQPDYWEAVQSWGTGGSFTQTDDDPVVGVTYYEAEACCNWVGGNMHLPTEAQWEKAARWTGSHANVYPWGDPWDVQKCNNWNDTSLAGGGYQKRQTSPVGSYPSGASPYGCQDMAGNVWQWCRDWYGPTYYSVSPASDPTGPVYPISGSPRVIRGCSWYNFSVGYFRCAYRYNGLNQSGDANDVGFRLAR